MSHYLEREERQFPLFLFADAHKNRGIFGRVLPGRGQTTYR